MIENRRSILKFFCCIFFLVNIISIFLSFFRNYFVDESLYNLLAYDAAGYALPLFLIWPIFIGTFLLMTAPLPFICKGSILANKFFIFGTVFCILLTLISGIRVTLPIENFLGALLYMSWGGILVLSFIDDDLKKSFEVFWFSKRR